MPEGAQVAKPCTRTRPPRHRLKQQADGQGAKVTPYQAGRERRVDPRRPAPGGRDRERQLKQHGATRRCHICKEEARAQNEASAAPALDAEAYARSEVGG